MASSSVVPQVSLPQDAAARTPVELIVCETCRIARPDADPAEPPCGQQLHEALLRERAERGLDAAVVLRTTRCFWVCKRSCAVQLRSPGRSGYLLCELDPRADAAPALLEYAQLYARSGDGAVPFREWPAGVRGHFLCRIPPGADPSAEDRA